MENLHEAFLRAARGKSERQTVIDFRSRLDENLYQMSQELLDGTYDFGQPYYFTVYDPKQRTICAAPFRDRVAFHAMMRICHPVFDNYQIHDSYASRIGKGTYKALERARQYAGQYEWFAKLDVCKYFESIDHQVMLSQLCRLFKDRQLLCYFQDLISRYEVRPGRGLAIGNLPSQYFANHHLAVIDHFMKEHTGAPALVRYMDDTLLMAHSRKELLAFVGSYQRQVKAELKLELHPPVINQTKYGIPFLGYIVYADRLRLNQRSRRRFKQKMEALAESVAQQTISQQEYARRAGCLMAFIDKADTYRYKQAMTNTIGVYPQGL